MSLTKRCLLWLGLALTAACGGQNSDLDNDGSRGALAAAEAERDDKDKNDDGDGSSDEAQPEPGEGDGEGDDGDGGSEPECPQGEPTGPISVAFRCDEVTVNTCKDLSNVVLLLENGAHQKIEGLNGHENTFAATGDHEGAVIVGVWVKSGANHSGDGPGYGERFDAPADNCDPSEPPTPPAGENPPSDEPAPLPL